MTSFNEGGFLDLLYGAAVEPGLWPAVLERLADAIGADSASLTRSNVVTGAGAGLIARMDPRCVDEYHEHWADKNVLNNVSDARQYFSTWRPMVNTDEDWMPKEEFAATEYYNDYLRRQDIDSLLMIRLARRGLEVSAINVNRSKRRGQFGTSEREVVARLHSHLIRAFELSERLAAGGQFGSILESVFDASSHGLFLVDGACRLLRVNPAGGAMTRSGKGILVCQGRLVAAWPEATKRLHGLVARAACRDHEAGRGGSLALPSASAVNALSIIVAPVRAQSPPLFQTGPCALVCVTDLEAGIDLPWERLRDLFGLTPAEARVALALLEGASPSEAAERLGVSANTVRVHLTHVFGKTGARRQSDLVRLMMRAVGLDLS